MTVPITMPMWGPPRTGARAEIDYVGAAALGCPDGAGASREAAYGPLPSREAAKECSPWRKPWVADRKRNQSRRDERKDLRERNRRRDLLPRMLSFRP